jgi:hypothetical protein
METKQCRACGKIFKPRPQVPDQCYCSTEDCQRVRRRHWQSAKRQNDSDYRDNQTRAQHAWSKRNPDYWKEYRNLNQEYAERNRALQRERNARRNNKAIAKMDVSIVNNPLPSGIYRLSRFVSKGIANMDAWIVKITALSDISDASSVIAKR